MVFAAIALVAPLVKIVLAGDFLDVGVQLIGAGEGGGLLRVYGIGLPAAGDFALSTDNRYDCGVASFVHAHSVSAGTQNREREIGRVDLERLILLEALDANTNRAFGDLNLRDIIGEVQEGEAGGAADTQGCRPDV